MSLELKRIIDQVSKEKGLNKNILISTIEEAIASAIKKQAANPMDIEIKYNPDDGEIDIFQYRTVVEKISNKDMEMSLEEAQRLDPESQLGDSIGVKLDIAAFGRIAAQSARQVIMQKLRTAERDLIYEEFKDRVGEIVNGIIQRVDSSGAIINLGRTDALLPTSEQLPHENLRRGERIRAYIMEIRKGAKDPQVILSRTCPEFLVKLFELEVPEIADGTIKIMAVARDPGSRSKISVSSNLSDVDPIGACVGMRGSRVQAVVQELRGERIDIVLWNPDPARYVYNALAPAECSKVIVDEDNHVLEIIVPDDQLSLAIGKQGQNVRLAGKLLGWKIDVKTETRHANLENPEYRNLLKLSGITENIADKLFAAGIDSVEKIAQMDAVDLAHISHMKRDMAKAVIEEAKGSNESTNGALR
ncbi:MAG: transcription termination factor NusA [Deltaproteobacteria bacterium]|jgi:N utilization substance protein A|nr:transcription termination factor NusA [Deltaproteobacteria bacterium]